MKRTDRTATVPWMTAGTAFVLDRLSHIDDSAYGAPSALPGWTNAHVAAHLARNAEAMRRLVTWAATGMETPAYASREQREADIAQSAQQSPAALRADIQATAAALSTAIQVCPETSWHTWIRGASGRPLQATEVPWLRTRELYVHSLDLSGPALTMADLPPEIVLELLDDVAASFTTRTDLAPIVMVNSDSGRMWALGAGGGGGAPDPVVVSGSGTDLTTWLVGRSSGAGLGSSGPLPILPPWL
jgi:maleylpyruvate isomerase